MNSKLFAYLSLAGLLLLSFPSPSSAATRAEGSDGEQVYVQLESTKLRSDTKHWAPAVASLKYGDRLTVIGTKEEWLNVRRGKSIGFVHVTAVTPREVVLESSKRKISAAADKDDIVLAGKGFGKDVEQSFLAKAGSGANIGAVNQMEKLQVADAQLLQFIVQGKLRKD